MGEEDIQVAHRVRINSITCDASVCGPCIDYSWFNNCFEACGRYPGGLKERSAERVHELDPGDVLRRAVNGMLPKNLLRKARTDADLPHVQRSVLIVMPKITIP
jgi:hypothetical protein